MNVISDFDIKAVLEVLKKIRGIDLTGYRQEMIKQRISARMTLLRIQDPRAYLPLIKDNQHECDALINEIMINASWFFRDPLVFEIIEQTLLPEILVRKERQKSGEIRIWSVGCAAGEEAFSTAILVHRAMEKGPANINWNPYIFATDIDTDALEKAKTGVYPRESFESTKLGILDRYFIAHEEGARYEIRSFIKDMVSFSKDDCTSSSHFAPANSVFGTFDMVLCRNVLVYFSPELQKIVLNKINKTITTGGYLVLGDSESLTEEIEREFLTLDSRNKIFQKTF
ncbi:MAG: protein-glutamate O-methyltransferase CheR [Candidatus Aminicenantes bacterium]|nr:MAG: protein-glutamate O-methyltransferase CheR [Candidatus Aminicenantes bacterium]